jgi:hypothetical protein
MWHQMWASSLSALLYHRHPQLATQCQEPNATHTSEPQAPHLVILLVPGGFPSLRAWRPSLTIKPSYGSIPTAPSESRNPALLLSSNLSFCGCQGNCFPKAQKDLALPTMSDHWRASASLLKTKNGRVSTEVRKAVTYYSVSGTRRSAPQGSQRPSTPHCA